MKINDHFYVARILSCVYHECNQEELSFNFTGRKRVVDHFAKKYGWSSEETIEKLKKLLRSHLEVHRQFCFTDYLELYEGAYNDEELLLIEGVCELCGIETKRISGMFVNSDVKTKFKFYW